MSAFANDTPTVIILDFVSQFFTKILKNDPKFTTYLKQWNSFRDVLINTPFSFTKALSFISELNMESPSKTPSPKRSSLQKQHSTPLASDFKLNLLGSLNHLEDKIYTRTQSWKDESANSNWELKLNSYNSPQAAAGISDGLKGAMSVPKSLHTRAFFFEDNHSETTKEASDSSLTTSHVSPLDRPVQNKNKPYSLANLTERSKKLQNMISTHSEAVDNVGTKSTVKETCYPEQRSPLRKMKVFGKKSDAAGVFEGSHDPLSFLVYNEPGSHIQLGKLFC